MNKSLGPGLVDLGQIGDLVRRSNTDLYTAITRFVGGGHRHMARRCAAPCRDVVVRRFLNESRVMQDYLGTSYRVSQISHDGLTVLQRGRGRQSADLGVQCAFVLPCNAAAWAINVAQAQLRDGAHQLFSIFDEPVPQKNLSTGFLFDQVIVPPATPLRRTGLRIISGRTATGPGRPRIIAHFAGGDPACDTPYDLYNGAGDA